MKVYRSAYYAANREKLKARSAAYYAKNRKKIAAHHAAYYAANRDAIILSRKHSQSRRAAAARLKP